MIEVRRTIFWNEATGATESHHTRNGCDDARDTRLCPLGSQRIRDNQPKEEGKEVLLRIALSHGRYIESALMAVHNGGVNTFPVMYTLGRISGQPTQLERSMYHNNIISEQFQKYMSKNKRQEHSIHAAN